MKTLTLVTSIIATHFSTAAEAWWLEMDKTFHDALIKRFSEGDPAACRQLGDRLPALIKEGKIKELEWVASDSKTGGRHFPAGEVERRFPDGRKFPLKTGSSVVARTNPDFIQFKINTHGGDAHSTLFVQSHAPMAKQWQPLFAIESDGRSRILLGRDPSAAEDFWKPRGLLSVCAPVPESTKVTWLLCEGHPLINGAKTAPTGKIAFALFREGTERFIKPTDDLRMFGTRLECETNPERGCLILFERFLEKNGGSAIGEVFTARGAGKIDPMGGLLKFPVNTYIEKIKGGGETENANKKDSGEAVAALTFFPNVQE